MRISRAMSFNQQQPRKFRQLPRPETLAGGLQPWALFPWVRRTAFGEPRDPAARRSAVKHGETRPDQFVLV
jgi:hypothetical protein